DAAGAAADALMAVASVDAVLGEDSLAPEALAPEATIAHVDEEACIRCLTCVRTCPHAAIEIADYGPVTAARVLDLACWGCGQCAANCPVRAIAMVGLALPAWLGEAE
ncbi:MAG: 4Fe-4S binding protein, partial [Chloroflexota bacterium]